MSTVVRSDHELDGRTQYALAGLAYPVATFYLEYGTKTWRTQRSALQGCFNGFSLSRDAEVYLALAVPLLSAIRCSKLAVNWIFEIYVRSYAHEVRPQAI